MIDTHSNPNPKANNLKSPSHKQSKLNLLIPILNLISPALNRIKSVLKLVVPFAVLVIPLLTLLDFFLKNFIFLCEAVQDIQAGLSIFQAVFGLRVEFGTLVL